MQRYKKKHKRKRFEGRWKSFCHADGFGSLTIPILAHAEFSISLLGK